MTMSVFRLHHLVEFTSSETGSPELADTILTSLGLTRDMLQGTDRVVASDKEAIFLRQACDALGDATFAVRAGLALRDSSTLTGYISRHSRTLRMAIENTQRYYVAVDTAFAYSLRITGNAAYFEIDRVDPTMTRYHRQNEYLLFAALARMRYITQTPFNPVEMRFDHEVRNAADAIRKLAGVPVTFGAERMEILLSLPTLDLDIPTFDPSLRTHLMNYGDRLLQERSNEKVSLSARVEGALTAGLPGRMATAEDVSAQLGMSTRTMARRLSDEGTSFRGVVDDLRCDLAKTHLKSGFGISEVAYILGYTEPAAFSTAFRRWTGQSPAAFRRGAHETQDMATHTGRSK